MKEPARDPCEASLAVGLPERLFGTDRYPVGRVNVYSRPDLLGFVHEQLKGTDEWEDIMRSSFGRLFNLPVTRCYISCKLLHSLLTRQLVTKRKYEMWTVFGRHPLRFSITEFEAVTGLNCQPFPSNYNQECNSVKKYGEGSAWEYFIGTNKDAKISDLIYLLRNSRGMSGWRKTGLALLLIVEGVLIANHQGNKRLTPRYVEMLSDREGFLNFPWGRESFLKTIASLIPSRASSNCSGSGCGIMQKQLKQVSISLKGFPLALQLFVFKVIPALDELIPSSSDMRTIKEVSFSAHAKNAALSLKAFLEVEDREEVSVLGTIELDGPVRGVLRWVDEVEDARVNFLEQLISDGHIFGKREWIGGDMSVGQRRRGKFNTFRAAKSSGSPKVKGDIVRGVIRRGRAYFTRSCNKVKDGVNFGSGCLTTDDFNCGDDVCVEVEFGNSSVEGDATDISLAKKDRPRGTTLRHTKASCSSIPKGSSNCGVKTGLVDKRNEGENELKAWMEIKLTELNSAWSKRFEEVTAQLKKSELLRGIQSPNVQMDNSHCPVLATSQVPVMAIVPYVEFKSPVHNYTPVRDGSISSVLYSDVSGVHHNVLPKRKFLVGVDGASLHNRMKKKKMAHGIVNQSSDGTAAVLLIKGHNEAERLSVTMKENNSEDLDCLGNEFVVVSDSSRQMLCPGAGPIVIEKEIAKQLLNSQCGNPSPVFQPLDLGKYKALQKYMESNPTRRYVTKCNFAFDNNFLLLLARPTAWVNTLHIEILMDMLGKHHAETLASRRASFVSPMFMNHLLSQQKHFEQSDDKRLFEWSTRINKVVAQTGSEWLVDVDVCYMPVIWGNKHWVGLVIDLRLRSIEVLDPYVDLTKEEKVKKHLSFLSTALPYVMKQCCFMNHASNIDLKPFNVSRVFGLYQNKRSGDCGPVAVKFLEMHAYGELHSSGYKINDAIVDDLRRQYVLDIYGHYVRPLHLV